MFDPIQKVNYLLENSREVPVEQLADACLLVIKDSSIKDRKKFETVTRAYESVSKYQGETPYLNEQFLNLYTIFKEKTIKIKYQRKCSEKSYELLQKMDGIDSLSSQLQNMTIGVHLPKKAVPQLKMNRVQSYSTSLDNDFFALLQSLNNETTHQDRAKQSDEVIFVQRGLKVVIKTIDIIKKTTPNIEDEGQKFILNNSLVSIEKTVENTKKLGTFQENFIFRKRLVELLTCLKRILEPTPSDTPRLTNGIHELLKILDHYDSMKKELIKIISIKINDRTKSSCDDLLKIQKKSNFFKFTERNYIVLLSNEDRRILIIKKIFESEVFFERMMRLPEIPESVFSTYISLLVQKHPFLETKEEKQQSLREIADLCFKYKHKYSKELENLQTLHEILKFNTDPKVSIKSLSPKKSPTDNDKKKADATMEKVIEKAKESLNLAALLEEKVIKHKKAKELEVSYLIRRTKETFNELLSCDLKNHNLTDLDILKIAYTVEKSFFFRSPSGYENQDHTIGNQNLVLTSPSQFLTRSLLIDAKAKKFTILSKLNGDIRLPTIDESALLVDLSASKEGSITSPKKLLPIPEDEPFNIPPFTYVTGAVKKISAAATFSWEQKKLVHKETILAQPKKTMVFDQKSIRYLFKFRGKRGLMSCDSYMEYYKKVSTGPKFKQILIQDRERGDLVNFLENNSLSQLSTWQTLFSILEDIAHGLSYMHSQGDIHWDIKLPNILFKENKGLLNDFDTTFDAKVGEQPSWLHPIYGIGSYQAPEVDLKEISSKEITEQEAKRRDMFALGCTLIDILCTGKTVAKGHLIYERIANKEITAQNIDLFIKQNQTSFLFHDHEKFLIHVAYNLIHPDPSKRWTVEQYKKEITDFQLKATKHTMSAENT